MATASLGSLILCAETDRLRDWQPQIVQDGVEVVSPLRHPDAVQYERGGLLVGYAFTVVRAHASYAAAADYLDDLPRAVGRAFGTFTAQRGLGSPTTTLRSAKARFEAEPLNGVLTTVHFTVTGSLPAGTT